MKIYKENNLNDKNFIVVSFFTKSYKDKADKLINSLNKFNINYKIFEIPTIHYSKSNKGSDDINYCMPKLIMKALSRFRLPILFIDCDMEIVQKPELFYRLDEKKIDFAIYNWLEDSDNDGYLPLKLNINTSEGKIEKTYFINKVNVKLLNHSEKEKQLFSSGAVAYFSNSDLSNKLLKDWYKNIKKYPQLPDDQILDYTFNFTFDKKNKLKIEWLSKNYCRVYWWIFTKPIINHPDNVSHREKDNFYKITGKKRFKIENTIKRETSKIPSDLIIDINEKKLLKIKNGKIFIIKNFKEKTYV